MDADALLSWFEAQQRPLPWRGPFPRDPYRVLVSEVMLQQTRVERVVDAFRLFLASFPTVGELAAAGTDDVIRAFSGLGYYRRARHLHAAARAVAGLGDWPRTRAALAALPGIGAYTSAAVAAFAFGGGDPPVDGNVARVAARHLGLALPLGSPTLTANADAFARSLHAAHPEPALWEALMELGARVCVPGIPRCGRCPLAEGCHARELGSPGAFPLPRRVRAPEAREWVALWVRRADGAVLLRRVDDHLLLGGLWLPPFAAVAPGRRAGTVAGALMDDLGLSGRLQLRPPVRHTITHRRITVQPFVAEIASPRVAEGAAALAWRDPERPHLATSTLLAKLRAVCGPPPAAPGSGSGER